MKRSIYHRGWLFLLIVLMLRSDLSGHFQAGQGLAHSIADKLCEDGHAQLQKGDYAGALNKFDAGRQAAAELGDDRALADNWLGIALVHTARSHLSQAIEAVESARRIAEAI